MNVASARSYPLASGRGVTVRYLLHAGVGARRIQLRLFTVEPNGCTPLERHEHEHEVYVLRGNLVLRGEDKEVVVGSGDAIFIPSMEAHQFSNRGQETAEFLCTKETGEAPETVRRTGDRSEGVRSDL